MTSDGLDKLVLQLIAKASMKMFPEVTREIWIGSDGGYWWRLVNVQNGRTSAFNKGDPRTKAPLLPRAS